MKHILDAIFDLPETIEFSIKTVERGKMIALSKETFISPDEYASILENQEVSYRHILHLIYGEAYEKELFLPFHERKYVIIDAIVRNHESNSALQCILVRCNRIDPIDGETMQRIRMKIEEKTRACFSKKRETP